MSSECGENTGTVRGTGEMHLPELRVVLLGARGRGKSSAGNSILGKAEFATKRPTAECLRRLAEVAGREVCVVDTPGWIADRSVQDTPTLIKQEIVSSMSQSLPGPHALLLVIAVDFSFTEETTSSVEEHLELLSKDVWRHVIVLFTRGDCLGDRTIEQYIMKEGNSLQALVEKCGNRYHIFNNNRSHDNSQVTKLLDKIEEMVVGHNGQLFQMDSKVLLEIEENRKATEQRAEQRRIKKQLEARSEQVGKGDKSKKLKIVLLGQRGAGKRSAGNTILGSELLQFEERTLKCERRQFTEDEKEITIVNTPGWTCYSVEDAPEIEKTETVSSVSLCLPRPHAFLLVINMGSSFTEKQRRSVEEHMGLLTESVWRHTIVLFTCADLLAGRTLEQHIESEGEALQWVVEKCGNRYHSFNNKDRSDSTQTIDLLEILEKMEVENRECPYENDVNNLEEIKNKKNLVEERAEQRKLTAQLERDVFASCHIGDKHLSEMRIVLLGEEATGKGSTGNTILGVKKCKSGRKTTQCETVYGEVAGRQLTITDTPGWSKHSPLGKPSERAVQEILSSLSLCSPGPHAILLMIKLGFSFKEQHKRLAIEHLELLGESVWKNTIVLFTCGDWLGGEYVEQHIESEGESLVYLLEKCGNRYHVLNNKYTEDYTQVTDLLEKIEMMVAKNHGQHLTAMDEVLIAEKMKQIRSKVENPQRKRSSSFTWIVPSLSGGSSGYLSMKSAEDNQLEIPKHSGQKERSKPSPEDGMEEDDGIGQE